MADVENSLLGKQTRYDSPYDAALLFPIARETSRAMLGPEQERFIGEDWWTCYEFSWLEMSGLPTAAVAHFRVPANSSHIIESKSFKLYLNSFNQQRFESLALVQSTLQADLSKAAGGPVSVEVLPLSQAEFPVSNPNQDWQCIDSSTFDATKSFVYTPDASLLKCENEGEWVTEKLYSNLLRSNCPVTDQPDWGTVFIRYTGTQINRESLLRYVVSFRQCQDFHEHCVERMFCDLTRQLGYESLSVYARYTRRGGLDINPFRCTEDLKPIAPGLRTVRQ